MGAGAERSGRLTAHNFSSVYTARYAGLADAVNNLFALDGDARGLRRRRTAFAPWPVVHHTVNSEPAFQAGAHQLRTSTGRHDDTPFSVELDGVELTRYAVRHGLVEP